MPVARVREPRFSDPSPTTRADGPSPFERWERQRNRWKSARYARGPGFGGDAESEELASAAAFFSLKALQSPVGPDELTIRWGGTAAEMQAWGKFIPSTTTIKLPTNFPRRVDLADSVIHECVHVAQKRLDRLPPRFRQSPKEHRRVEREAKVASAALLDSFLKHVTVDGVDLHEPHPETHE